MTYCCPTCGCCGDMVPRRCEVCAKDLSAKAVVGLYGALRLRLADSRQALRDASGQIELSIEAGRASSLIGDAIYALANAQAEIIANLPYQEVFNAIADAVTNNGTSIGISVETFKTSLRTALSENAAS